ncbi:unnamed protein product [Schistosoma mattheei]|uniref:Uncharacterized protein n=1 Tax=Schistosoma mattheei TaxID=31246 RepID=A0A3P8CV35_9TREM|nr:unnamed protein product [Schistosoma mattheei]
MHPFSISLVFFIIAKWIFIYWQVIIIVMILFKSHSEIFILLFSCFQIRCFMVNASD